MSKKVEQSVTLFLCEGEGSSSEQNENAFRIYHSRPKPVDHSVRSSHMGEMSLIESDEAFARRLQAQEMGIHIEHTPLVGRQQPTNNGTGNRNRNPTVINARLNELSSARATVCAILTVNTPQIIAAFIVLSMHWNDPVICDAVHATRWKWWALTAALRMFAYSQLVLLSHIFKPWLDERPNENAIVTNMKNVIDAFGLIWFITGNMWLFGDDDLGCRHPERSPVYELCISLLIINYIQICLPCIIAVLMIPVFCFCMPCLIRILARLHDPRAAQGATDDIISRVPLVVITNDHLRQNGDEHRDNSCAICLSELTVGEEARILQCKHMFHKQCVDEWLRVNATCPTCRNSVIARTDESGGSGGIGSDSSSGDNNRSNNSDRSNDDGGTGAVTNPGTSLTLGNAYTLISGGGGGHSTHGNNNPSASTATTNATVVGTSTTAVRRNSDSTGATNRSGHRVITLNFQLDRR